MKKLIPLMMCLVLSVMAFAQTGVDFQHLTFDEAYQPLSWAKIIWQDWQINMWQSYKFPVRLAAFAMSKILQKLSGILAR